MKFSTEYYLLDSSQIKNLIEMVHDNFPHLNAADTTVRVNAPDGQRLSPIVTVTGHCNHVSEFRQYEDFEVRNGLDIYTAQAVLSGSLRSKVAELEFAAKKDAEIDKLKQQEMSVKSYLANALEFNRYVGKINWTLRLFRAEAKGQQPQLIDVEPHKAELNRIREEIRKIEETKFVWEEPDDSDGQASDDEAKVGTELADVLAIGSTESDSSIARTFAGIVVGAVTVVAAYAVKRGKG